MLNVNNKTFMVHMAIRKQKKMLIYFKKQGQIEAQSEAQIMVLLFDIALIEILAKYSNHSNIFLAKNTVKLLENTKINKYAIELKKISNHFLDLSIA